MAASASSPAAASPSVSSLRYRQKSGGDIVRSILAGEGPWFQNACSVPLGANTKAPAEPSTISSLTWKETTSEGVG